MKNQSEIFPRIEITDLKTSADNPKLVVRNPKARDNASDPRKPSSYIISIVPRLVLTNEVIKE